MGFILISCHDSPVLHAQSSVAYLNHRFIIYLENYTASLTHCPFLSSQSYSASLTYCPVLCPQSFIHSFSYPVPCLFTESYDLSLPTVLPSLHRGLSFGLVSSCKICTKEERI